MRVFCEICGSQCDDSRDWLIVSASENIVVVQRWSYEAAELTGTRSVCGCEHATRMLKLWSAGQLSLGTDGALELPTCISRTEKQMAAMSAAMLLPDCISSQETFDA